MALLFFFFIILFSLLSPLYLISLPLSCLPSSSSHPLTSTPTFLSAHQIIFSYLLSIIRTSLSSFILTPCFPLFFVVVFILFHSSPHSHSLIRNHLSLYLLPTSPPSSLFLSSPFHHPIFHPFFFFLLPLNHPIFTHIISFSPFPLSQAHLPSPPSPIHYVITYLEMKF